ncbi:hypothetical protein NHX12_022302 [Muraenolepis orangiensis]|uniref:Uncharacterized protein n=1 Tax=Muraenolepis orangiensis TaxID=630683 RepID=A0A9Q0EPK2_9TELE|nr:hypothetical protein NHX12_022302 [Muraenolepis orangiensis]
MTGIRTHTPPRPPTERRSGRGGAGEEERERRSGRGGAGEEERERRSGRGGAGEEERERRSGRGGAGEEERPCPWLCSDSEDQGHETMAPFRLLRSLTSGA